MCYQRFSHVMLGVMEAIAIDLASNDTLVSIRASYRQRPLQNSFSPTAETQTKIFGCFCFKDPLILPKYPLNPPRTPDNQASEPPFRRQQTHLAC